MAQSRFRSAAQLSARYSDGSADPVEIVEQALARIAVADRAIFTLVTADRARAEALASRKRQQASKRHGILDGVPIAWKDLFGLAGITTTAGSRALPECAEARDADIVARMAAGGLVTVGRVNMSEFAFSGLGLNPIFGTPGNARNPLRIPGGSSSGSAVAVASGIVPISIGTDTGGSVRIPAALNGIVGFKATAGRYSTAGMFPLSPTLDSVGVLCKTVGDAALADSSMRGMADSPLLPASLAGLRVVAPTNVVMDACSDLVLTNFEASLTKLGREGAVVERASLPAFEAILEVVATHGALVNADAYAIHRERLEGPAALVMDRRVVSRARLGARTTPADRQAILAARETLSRQTAARLDGAVVAFPTTAVTAPAIALLESDDDAFFRANALMLRNTMLGNFLNWCGVSLPNGFDRDGMPTGLLLSAPGGSDRWLLAQALAIHPIIDDFAEPPAFQTE
jgi:aspartyl-tRNA(Asn)/glutamyl-tRNA(Gln) amidotransferase subunit A